MTPTELEAYDAMMRDRDRWREKAEGLHPATENAVVQMIRQRGEVGRKKYGIGMDRRDLSLAQWIQHLQEELADGLQYAERMKGGASLLDEARSIMETLADERGWEVAADWVKRFDEQFPITPLT
jgi:hypothetical protein